MMAENLLLYIEWFFVSIQFHGFLSNQMSKKQEKNKENKKSGT